MLDGYGPLRFNVGLVLSGLLQLIQLELHATSGDSVTVQTKYGTLRGSPSPLDSRVSQFLGIPFAAPPVGDSRWKPPQPVNPWVGTRDALSFGYSCVQTKSNDYFYTESLFGYFYGNQSEDCLTLNVWTSSNCIMADKNCSLPVLVWIYGGSFIIGGTNKKVYDGSLLAKEGAIVVTLNYRLGIFGFFVHQELMDQDKSNVNFGFQDQQYALRWVKDNIAAFGGDPYRITVFGESAGSFSISAQIVMPASFNLYRRAFMISGAYMQKYPASFSGNLIVEKIYGSTCILEHLGCRNITCARQTLTASQLMAAAEAAEQFNGFTFEPVLDGVVLPKLPLEALTAGEFARPLDVATLTMQDEGTCFVDMKARDADLDKFFAMFSPHDAVVKQAYTGKHYPSAGWIEAAAYGDFIFSCPMRSILGLVARGSPGARTYQGVFTHPVSWLANDSSGYATSIGVPHSSANPFVFGSSYYPFTPAEAGISALLRRNLISFAANGSMPDFPPWTPTDRRYLTMDVVPTVGTDYLRSNCDLLGAAPLCPLHRPRPQGRTAERLLLVLFNHCCSDLSVAGSLLGIRLS